MSWSWETLNRRTWIKVTTQSHFFFLFFYFYFLHVRSVLGEAVLYILDCIVLYCSTSPRPSTEWIRLRLDSISIYIYLYFAISTLLASSCPRISNHLPLPSFSQYYLFYTFDLIFNIYICIYPFFIACILSVFNFFFKSKYFIGFDNKKKLSIKAIS